MIQKRRKTNTDYLQESRKPHELFEILVEAEEDVKRGRVTPMEDVVKDLKSKLQDEKLR